MRVLRDGCFYRGLNILGYLCIVLGVLMTLGGLAGFISTLLKTAPDIFSARQYLDQPFTLFVLTLIAVYFGAYSALGCAGLITIGFGFLAIARSTKSDAQHPIDKPLS